MALSITSATSETAARVLSGLEQLRGCDAFFSVKMCIRDSIHTQLVRMYE